MPIVQITLLEGRSTAQKEAMYREVTDALVRTVNAKPENVRIIVQDTPHHHFAVAGVAKTRPGG